MTYNSSISDSELYLGDIKTQRKKLPRTNYSTLQAMPDKFSTISRKSSLSRAASLDIDITKYDQTEPNLSRSRSNSLPSSSNLAMIQFQQEMESVVEEHHKRQGERHLFALMLNIGHIIIAVAVTQLGIVGAWYSRFMNFEEEMIRYIVYICLLFAISGIYGLLVLLKKLQDAKAHRIAYCILTTLSITAAAFIASSGLRLTLLDTYRSDITPIVLFDGFVIGLSVMEIPMGLIGMYLTVPNLCKKVTEESELSSEKSHGKPKASICESWTSIFRVILNVAHVVLGLCILELGMVGMLYRRFMNVESTGLLIVVLVSVTFVSLGVLGLINQVRGRTNAICNQVMYTCGSLVVVGLATFILTIVSMAINSQYYYSGFEAIVAFDSMIVSISSIELIVAVAAMLLGLMPYCKKRLCKSDDVNESSTRECKKESEISDITSNGVRPQGVVHNIRNRY